MFAGTLPLEGICEFPSGFYWSYTYRFCDTLKGTHFSYQILLAADEAGHGCRQPTISNTVVFRRRLISGIQHLSSELKMLSHATPSEAR